MERRTGVNQTQPRAGAKIKKKGERGEKSHSIAGTVLWEC